MASKTGVNIYGNYVVSVNAMLFCIICTVNSDKLKSRTESYFTLFLNSTTIRHGVLISGCDEFIPTAVRSN